MALNIKKIKPLYSAVITTADTYETDQQSNGVIIKVKGNLKEYQRVVAIGPMVRNIEVGNLVKVNPSAYAVMKHQPGSLKDGVISDNVVQKYQFKMVEIDGVNHLMLQDRDIDFVIEEFEEVEEEIPDSSNVLDVFTPHIITTY